MERRLQPPRGNRQPPGAASCSPTKVAKSPLKQSTRSNLKRPKPEDNEVGSSRKTRKLHDVLDTVNEEQGPQAEVPEIDLTAEEPADAKETAEKAENPGAAEEKASACDKKEPLGVVEEKAPEVETRKPKSKLPKVPAELLEWIAAREENETTWTSPPIDHAETLERWPAHADVEITKEVIKRWTEVAENKAEPIDDVHDSIVHFESACLEDFDIKLGDFVEIALGEEDVVGRLLELFETTEGVRMCYVHWYYPPQETRLAIDKKNLKKVPEDFDPVPVPLGKRLFMATDRDNETYNRFCPLDSINRVIKVLHLPAGAPQPSDEQLEGYDFWWDLQYDNQFFTFINPGVPVSKELYAKQDTPRVIRALDLYCGCGGLSELDHESEKVIIKTSWAVDFEQDMCDSFTVNHPDAHVHCMGVDEFEWLCRKFLELSQKFPEGCPELMEDVEEDDEDDTPLEEDVFEVEAILSMQLKDKAKRKLTGVDKGQLEEDLSEENCWLEFFVKWKGYPSSDNTWEPLENLTCPEKVARFVQKIRNQQSIPLPGQVDLVMGGPPCQGVSGLNRHAARVDVLKDVRNRQGKAFYSIVGFFNPSFVLMEQVQDIFKKEDGLYAKYAAAELVRLRYQTRMGVISAASQGVPQGRYRVFVWGAVSGQEQLPPFPEPTHRAFFTTPVPQKALDCVVDFLTPESKKNAYPPVVIGDVLSDLPEVSNFSVSESLPYASPPQTPFQMWLRRNPPKYQPSAAKRARKADEIMRESHDALNGKMLDLATSGRYEELGRMFFNNRNPQGDSGKKCFAAQVWQKFLEGLEDDEERDKESAEMQQRKNRLATEMGRMVAAELKKAASSRGPVRDHRPLVCNADDYLRMVGVPFGRDKCFRHMRGVVINEDGRVCCGHTHVALDKNGKTSCLGGGTRTEAPSSITKTGRVDHHDKEGWRGVALEGCNGTTEFLPSGDLLVPRWTITYRKGKSQGRAGCFGRFHEAEVQPTVVGRAEPHNLALVHPHQHRVVTILENKRCQGFPDYYCLSGKAGKEGRPEKTWVRSASLNQRFKQIGNAVCPAVARALGRCLALAAVGEAPIMQPVVPVPDKEYDECWTKAHGMGLKSYVEANPDELYGARGGKFLGRDLLTNKLDIGMAGGEEAEEDAEPDEDELCAE